MAYDVLRMEEDSLNIRVQTFLTIGSPLGFPIVGEKIRGEFRDRRTPKNVKRWVNLADSGDMVALDINLANEYQPNDAGVQVQDILVRNGYRSPKGETSKHKSYGYLRAPEVSDVSEERGLGFEVRILRFCPPYVSGDIMFDMG